MSRHNHAGPQNLCFGSRDDILGRLYAASSKSHRTLLPSPGKKCFSPLGRLIAKQKCCNNVAACRTELSPDDMTHNGGGCRKDVGAKKNSRIKLTFLSMLCLLSPIVISSCCLHSRNAIIATPPYSNTNTHCNHLQPPPMLSKLYLLPLPHRRLAVVYCRCCHCCQALFSAVKHHQALLPCLTIAIVSPHLHCSLPPPLLLSIAVVHCSFPLPSLLLSSIALLPPATTTVKFNLHVHCHHNQSSTATAVAAIYCHCQTPTPTVLHEDTTP
jgi:hypothetical protein